MDERTETDSADPTSTELPLEAVVDRLAERFPTVDRPHIEDLVETGAAELDEGARVRDFIPVLVEHEAKEQLRTEADPAPLDATPDEDAAPAAPRPRAGDAGDVEARTSTTPLLPHGLDGRN